MWFFKYKPSPPWKKRIIPWSEFLRKIPKYQMDESSSRHSPIFAEQVFKFSLRQILPGHPKGCGLFLLHGANHTLVLPVLIMDVLVRLNRITPPMKKMGQIFAPSCCLLQESKKSG